MSAQRNPLRRRFGRIENSRGHRAHSCGPPNRLQETDWRCDHLRRARGSPDRIRQFLAAVLGTLQRLRRRRARRQSRAPDRQGSVPGRAACRTPSCCFAEHRRKEGSARHRSRHASATSRSRHCAGSGTLHEACRHRARTIKNSPRCSIASAAAARTRSHATCCSLAASAILIQRTALLSASDCIAGPSMPIVSGRCHGFTAPASVAPAFGWRASAAFGYRHRLPCGSPRSASDTHESRRPGSRDRRRQRLPA